MFNFVKTIFEVIILLFFSVKSSEISVLDASFCFTNNSASFNEKFLTNNNNPPKFFVEFFKDQKNLENINCFALDIEELPLKTSSNNEKLNDKEHKNIIIIYYNAFVVKTFSFD